MDVVGDELHATREFHGIRHDFVRLRIAFAKGPAVVDDDVFVSGVLESELHEEIGGFEHDLLVDLLAERVPGVPPHGRSHRKRMGHVDFLDVVPVRD